MSRPIPPEPEIIVKGNDGHMPQRGVWRYDAFYVSPAMFASATVEYRIRVMDRRPDSLSVVVYDANATLLEIWGTDGELLPEYSNDDPLHTHQWDIVKIAVLDWFWAYDVNKVTKLELEALNR